MFNQFQERKKHKRAKNKNSGNRPPFWISCSEGLKASSSVYHNIDQNKNCIMVSKEGADITEAEAAVYDRQIRLWGMESQKRFATVV